MHDISEFVNFTKNIYRQDEILLHRPIFSNLEVQYLKECISSNFVSSVGKRVVEFEDLVADFVGVKRAVACVNGTSALHMALKAVGVNPGSQVITQALTFVATSNAINYCGADHIFIDVDIDSLGMSPLALKAWLDENVTIKAGKSVNKNNGKIISCCLPMHTFGMPCRINEIAEICLSHGIPLVEDTAESLGSRVENQHTGTFGAAAAFSFNGNKIITTGGGGMVVTNDTELADKLKHLTTTAKRPHAFEYFHDEVGYNYRLPNINAAIGVAQMEILDQILERKRELAESYKHFFSIKGIKFVEPINGSVSNNWLNAIILNNRAERDQFLQITNDSGVMTRPIWNLMTDLPMYSMCENDGLRNSRWLVDRVVNIPSSVPDIG